MIRLGLCCLFNREPIRFRDATARAMLRLEPAVRREHLSELCLFNADALLAAVRWCGANGVGCFRVKSQILPLKTHPEAGCRIRDLPRGAEIVRRFKAVGAFAAAHDIRLSFHPDQFIVLSSPDGDVVRRSVLELAYQAEVAGWVGADVINVHAGGGYGDKPAALARLARVVRRLPSEIRSRLTVENDDRVYSPAELLDFCRSEGVPLVYDVHHHRCLPDGHSVEWATREAIKTWGREPLFHVSSPRDGWAGRQPARHHDQVSIRDFPRAWLGLDITVEVEAKAKERAVLRLARAIRARGGRIRGPQGGREKGE